MSLVRYEPWPAFDKLSKELGTLLNQRAGANSSLTGDDDSNIVTSRWSPAVDIREQDDRFVLAADIPGVDPKNIEITMDRNVLTIKGERSFENTQSGNGFKRIERAHGTFYRRFSLPDSADADKIEAHGENGVLSIVIPKKQKAQPRRINVAA